MPTTNKGPYVLSFKMSGNFACGAATSRNVTVYWDGNPTPIGTYSFPKPGFWSRTTMGWTAKSVVLPAPATVSTKLTFVDTSAGYNTEKSVRDLVCSLIERQDRMNADIFLEINSMNDDIGILKDQLFRLRTMKNGTAAGAKK